MAKILSFLANWRIEHNGHVHEAGSAVKLPEDAVEEHQHLIDAGALSPTEPAAPAEPSAPSGTPKLEDLTKAQLREHALDVHGVDLNGDLSKDELVSAVQALSVPQE